MHAWSHLGSICYDLATCVPVSRPAHHVTHQPHQPLHPEQLLREHEPVIREVVCKTRVETCRTNQIKLNKNCVKMLPFILLSTTAHHIYWQGM